MKGLAIRWVLSMAVLLAAVPASAAPWVACGNLSQINANCQLPSYPSTHYEYGMQYNTTEPQLVTCSYWNTGLRIYNRLPFVVEGDNPQLGVRWGGFMFYTGTLAPDDDTCPSGEWRHQYWRLDANNIVLSNLFSNGCFGTTLPIFCRAR